MELATPNENEFQRSPGCGNAGCVCHKPGPVCEEHMGYGLNDFCARCGWEEAAHPRELEKETQ